MLIVLLYLFHMTLLEELQWRGFVNQTTFPKPEDINEPRTFYLGVDPSAPSMHIGNLAAVMLVKHLVNHGHKAIVLVGGATGMIGDPKEDNERDLKTLDEIAINKKGIAAQYEKLLGGEPFTIVDNYDWFKDIGYLEFLRDIGKHFSMTQLLDRDFIKARIGEGGVGISYAEFSYSLIQGYDFLHLFRENGASLQIGGSDQWGNMVSGAQMIRKFESAEAHVWTVPLILDKTTGKKFGKSEGNAVWLDPNMISPFQFYQFWLNVDDESVIDYLKIYTLLPKEEVERLAEETTSQPQKRMAQQALAYEVTSIVHGQERAEASQRVTKVLFGGSSVNDLNEQERAMLSVEIPTADSGQLVDILVKTELASSLGEARRLIEGGAISIDGQKVSESREVAAPSLVKKGKNNFVFVK